MISKIKIAFLSALVGVISLAGCASDEGFADVYTPGAAQREQTVRMGVVESVRIVKMKLNEDGTGATVGAITGGVIGSGVGQGRGSALGMIGGGLAGGLVGKAIERRVRIVPALEITVRLDNGELRAITQRKTNEEFRAGDRVRLLAANGVTRVQH